VTLRRPAVAVGACGLRRVHRVHRVFDLLTVVEWRQCAVAHELRRGYVGSFTAKQKENDRKTVPREKCKNTGTISL